MEKYENVKTFGFSRGLQNVKFEGKNAIADRCNFSGNIRIGWATTLGYNNVIQGDVEIGKYCQLGFDVAIISNNHPLNYMTTYINKNLFDGELHNLKKNEKIVIGNDVWIGHNVTIVGNVKIGNGAVLAAGAVVTKDVEPYTIVGGVPAEKIKKRFKDSIIKEIEELDWWNKKGKELEDLKPLFFKHFKNKESIYE
ncbi:CatB-related O-acetyltransferase [uncultured Polaribacter sp.]|uniref:CatB-related O-acetyltransferase n=1 Tax=uncultured Polaribacter sp. TaxID=174711 RepID=UPI00260275B7|nr:CatB-related O-acetyltransferase [uncultured Polaribacter sp.]